MQVLRSLAAWVTLQRKAGGQVGEEANVSPVAPAVVPQVWQLEAPFIFEGAEHENSCDRSGTNMMIRVCFLRSSGCQWDYLSAGHTMYFL